MLWPAIRFFANLLFTTPQWYLQPWKIYFSFSILRAENFMRNARKREFFAIFFRIFCIHCIQASLSMFNVSSAGQSRGFDLFLQAR